MAHVEVYILNYNGVGFLPPCLEALRRLDPGSHTYHVNVIDNGSADNSRQLVSERFPEISYIALDHNHGFSRGNNLGVWERTAQLLPAEQKDLITVFLNNDTMVEPGWLKHAADAFARDSKVGIVGSKSIFLDRFVVLDLEVSPVFSPKQFGADDARELGVFMHTSMRGENCFLDQRRNKLVGFYPPEGRGRWTIERSRFFLAVQDPSKPCRIVLSFENHHPARIKQQLNVRLNEQTAVLKELELLSLSTTELELEFTPAEYVDVVQNAGSYVTPRWEGGDRGFLEIDRGQFDQPQAADSICGVSMFIRHELFASLKGFDEHYFAYYEDTDLSLRARLAGYSLVYEPRSVLRHLHCGSSVEYSDYFNNNVAYSYLIFASKMMSLVGWREQLRSYWERATREFHQYEQDRTLSRKPHLRAMARMVKRMPRFIGNRLFNWRNRPAQLLESAPFQTMPS